MEENNMEQYIIQFDVIFTDELDNFTEKTATGFVSATSHSEAVKQIEQYFGEHNTIAIAVEAWDTSVLLVPSNLIKPIEKENFEK